jgi:hypothetical protein
MSAKLLIKLLLLYLVIMLPKNVMANTVMGNSINLKCHPQEKYFSEGKVCLDDTCATSITSTKYASGYQLQLGANYMPVRPSSGDNTGLYSFEVDEYEIQKDVALESFLTGVASICQENMIPGATLVRSAVGDWKQNRTMGWVTVEPYSESRVKELDAITKACSYGYVAYEIKRMENWMRVSERSRTEEESKHCPKNVEAVSADATEKRTLFLSFLVIAILAGVVAKVRRVQYQKSLKQKR